MFALWLHNQKIVNSNPDFSELSKFVYEVKFRNYHGVLKNIVKKPAKT